MADKNQITETLAEVQRMFLKQTGDHPRPDERAIALASIRQAEATLLLAEQTRRIANILENLTQYPQSDGTLSLNVFHIKDTFGY